MISFVFFSSVLSRSFTKKIYFPPGARFDDGAGGDNEVQRTMLELINQLDGFDPRGNIKVLMATNRYTACTRLSNKAHFFFIPIMNYTRPICM